MPPDDTDGLDPDEFPGLHDDQADDADLPGLDDDSPPSEPDGSADAAETADGDVLDQLDQNLAEQGARFDAEAAARDQAHAELDEWRELAGDTVTTHEWDRMSLGKKKEIRGDWWGGWDFRWRRYRWMVVVGVFLPLVLMAGFFLRSGSDETDATTAPSSTEAAVTETAPPATVPPVTATTAPPVPAIATVTGTLDPVLPADPLFVHSVTSSVLTMEFPTAGGPFSGTAVLELLHDVPSEGCQFQSVHEWEFSGMFDSATREFWGTFTELQDETTGNCDPGQAHLIYQMNPAEGEFYAGLHTQDGEIRGSAFTTFTASVSQTLIDGLSGS